MVKRGVLLVLALILVGCGGGDARAPFTDSRIPPGLGQKYWPPEGWAWGLIQVGGAPPQRYGVVAPATVTRVQVLILPGYGDFAEAWYETAAALTQRGFTVWVLDGADQGGSGRLAGPRDLGHVTSFEPDAAAITQMVGGVIRPQARQPLVVIADGTAAPLAERVFGEGRAPASGLILTSPTFVPPVASVADIKAARSARRVGLGALRAPGGQGWSRAEKPLPEGAPAAVRQAWQVANPDLRMGGPSLGWLAAFADLDDDLANARPAAAPPTLILMATRGDADIRRWDELCRAQTSCVATAIASPRDARAHEIAFIEQLMPKDGPPPRVDTALPKPADRR